MEDLTGKKLANFRIVKPLGEGGMAKVFKAKQQGLDRYVALKVMSPLLMKDPNFLGRFRQEANVLAQLQHPRILPVFDYGETVEGYVYLVMPLIESGTLSDLMKGQPLPLAQIEQVISQTGEALGYAHSAGVVHRDVKPSNVLVDEQGNCLLSDFGISKIIEGSSQFTATGALIGTPAYMSPEQGQGRTLDGRSDLYSLGVILYEMATGRIPFRAETPVAIIYKHVSDPLPPPRSLNPDLPRDLETVIIKALAKDPDARYQSAYKMRKAVRAAIPEKPAHEVAPAATEIDAASDEPPESVKPAVVGASIVSPAEIDHEEIDRLKEEEKASAADAAASAASVAGQESTSSSRDKVFTIALMALFGLVAACSAGFGLLALLTSSETDSLALLPMAMGITVGAIGAIVMVWLRERHHVSWVVTLLAVGLWFIGESLFATGISTVFLGTEPTELVTDLGLAVGLCMAPGGLMALTGIGLFWFGARRAAKK